MQIGIADTKICRVPRRIAGPAPGRTSIFPAARRRADRRAPRRTAVAGAQTRRPPRSPGLKPLVTAPGRLRGRCPVCVSCGLGAGGWPPAAKRPHRPSQDPRPHGRIMAVRCAVRASVGRCGHVTYRVYGVGSCRNALMRHGVTPSPRCAAHSAGQPAAFIANALRIATEAPR